VSLLDLLRGRKHAPMIGLDISSSSAKLVELGQTGSGEMVLERFAYEPFEKGWITDGTDREVRRGGRSRQARVVAKSGTRTGRW
jgi:type IV pilus assembly protein PilM